MMQGEHWRIANEGQRANLVRHVMACEMPFRVQVLLGERTLPQNALSHVWYGEIAKRDRSDSADGWRRFCKLRFGVPILRADTEDSSFRDRWDRLIKPRFAYEEKLELMHDFPVTSLMNPPQMAEYLTAIQAHFAASGIVLTGLDKGLSDYPEARSA